MYIVAAILAFGILVLVHEFGHFIMAKANGIKVEEFSIGMGPKLIGIKGKETEYLIKLLPIGGYVKMLGDEEKSTDERAFNNKSPLRKLSVVVADYFYEFSIKRSLICYNSVSKRILGSYSREGSTKWPCSSGRIYARR